MATFIDPKTINLCKVMDGAESIPFMKFIVDLIRSSAPKLFQKCPNEMPLEIYNITIDDEVTKKMKIFPNEMPVNERKLIFSHL